MAQQKTGNLIQYWQDQILKALRKLIIFYTICSNKVESVLYKNTGKKNVSIRTKSIFFSKGKLFNCQHVSIFQEVLPNVPSFVF